MERIWAPWRANYLSTVTKKEKGCLFCRIGKGKKDKADHVFLRWKHCYAVLNLYPYNNGHSLVVPYRHIKDLIQLKSEERQELFNMMDYVRSLLDGLLKPDGYNIGMNIGRAAGAGIPDHIHMHIVPRWSGDENFMPVIAGTKIISQSLNALHSALKKADKQRKRK